MSSEGNSTDRWFVRCQIVRWVSDDEPGVVECKLIDAFGDSWTFVGKCPYFTGEQLSSESVYPQPGYIACEIVTRDVGERRLIEIDTDSKTLCGYESEDGFSRFKVASDQLVPNELPERDANESVIVVTATRK